MPDFKRVKFLNTNDAGTIDEFSTMIKIDSKGVFYTHIPEKLRSAISEHEIDSGSRQRKGFIILSASTFSELEGAVNKAHRDFLKPTVKEERVIRYNIESHVSFALTKDGQVFPNAGFPGAEWPREDESFGSHHAARASDGGYSMTIGAEAVTKKTTTYGKESSARYEPYYKGGSHLGRDNPAQLLNSWVSFHLPDNACEIPYSDEAAMFFFGLMQSMAEMNLRIQNFTNTPEKLAHTIAKVSGQLLLSGPSEAERSMEEK